MDAGGAKGFEQRIRCIREQYAGYVIVDGIHLSSKLMSGDDVADLGATLMAYAAWEAQQQGKGVHAVGGFTPEQRFSLGMGQWACEKDRPENLRVKVFGCKAGQPRAHAPACTVW